MKSASNLLMPTQRHTAQEAVVETIRKAILGGDLPGGTRLGQADIAAQLNVSTTPVREAMRVLAAEGLVQLDAYRGAVVREHTPAEAREIYTLRLLLEPLAVRAAIERVTDEELEHIAQLERLASQERDPGTWVMRNRAFHEALTAPANSPRLMGILNGLRDAAAIHVGASIQARREQMHEGNADHGAMVEAFRQRDAEAAVRVTERHLRSTLRAIDRDGD